MNFEIFKQHILDAAKSADTDTFLRLIESCSDFSAQMFDIFNKNGNTVVHLAAQSGSIGIIRYCYLHNGSKMLMQRNKDGKMPLHIAAHFGQLQCVEYLLTCNVPVDALKRSDWTPLMLACTKTNLDVVKILIKFGANLTYRNKDGWTAFHIATREGCEGIVRYLLEKDSILWKTQSKNKRTPLHTAALHGRTEVVKLLLWETDHPVDCVDSCGTTPIMDAVSSCHNEIVWILIDKGASVTKNNSLGNNLLHLAAQAGNMEICSFLVNDCHLNINSKTNHGLTALHFAVKERNLLCIQKLLNLGADKTLQDFKGRTAQDYTTDVAVSALLTANGTVL